MSHRRRNNLAASVLLALSVVTAGAWAQRTNSVEHLLAHATDQMYWIAQVESRTRANGQTDYWTVIRARQVGGDGRWSEIGRVPARITSIANRGTDLVALLESGDWMVLWAGGSAMGRASADGARIVTLGSGPASLWAIGVGATAPPATTQTSTTGVSYDGPGLYQLDQGRWVRRAALPADLVAEHARAILLAVVAGEPVVAVRAGDAGDDLVRLARWSDSGWVDLGGVFAADAVQLKLLGGADAPALWLAPEKGAGWMHVLGDSRWSDPRPLSVSGGAPEPQFPDRAITASSTQNIRLAFASADRVWEQTFARDGATLGSAEPLPMLPAQGDPAPLRWLTTAAAAMLMMVVLGSVRRGPPPEAVPGINPAPLSMRFMAGMIDAIPLAVATVLLSREVNSPEPTVDELMAAVGIPFYISLGLYLLHTWVSEQLFGRTIGKFIFGLRVASLDGGGKPGAGAIFVRNLMRLVDVMILVPLVLVIFSPLRQRVGDIAARTVVVTDAPRQPRRADEKAE